MKIITAKEAVELVKDNDWIATESFGLSGFPEELFYELGERYRNTGSPKNLSFVHAGGWGNFQAGDKHIGADYITQEGLLKQIVASHNGDCPVMMSWIMENKIAGWYFPLGTMLQVYSEQGRGMPGALSKVGLGTFMDSRVDGGCLNDKARESDLSFVEYVPDFFGEEFLFYKKYPMDFCFLRGTYADEKGNISLTREAMNLGIPDLARAGKANGATVIVQVERIVATGSIHPKHVAIPGVCVDYAVVNTRTHKQFQTHQTHYNPAFSGEVRAILDKNSDRLPLTPQKIACRRVAMELAQGDIANFGLGMPQSVGKVLDEEECSDLITTVSECGSIGGVPMPGLDFGAHTNIEASINQKLHFDWIDGGGMDISVIGIPEVDKDGNINATLLNGRLGGVGGLANICSSARTTILVGTFTVVGLEERIEDGKLIVDQEGKFCKFVDSVPQVTFNANEALKLGKNVIFITERCVLEKTEQGFILKEIAPGIDLQKDILDVMGFEPVIPEGGPALMPDGIFREDWGGLKDVILNK